MDLFSHLNWYSGVTTEEGEPIKSIPTGKLIVISDTLESEGSFLIHYFLQSIFKSTTTPNANTTNNTNNTWGGSCLLGLNQSLYNYFNIGRKLGYNLTNENAKGNFTFINGLSTPYQWIIEQRVQQLEEQGLDEEPPLDSISQGFAPFPITHLNSNIVNISSTVSSTSTSNNNELKNILQKIYNEFINDHKKRIQKNPSNKTLFIIDGLNILSSYNSGNPSGSFMDIVYFLQYCHNYIKENSNTCSMLILFHPDCDEDSKFFNLLQYEADLTINITNLKSGYSKDIDGQLNFIQKDEKTNTFVKVNPIHYQALDNSIRFFSMGSRIQ
ncbi:hypothetical protein DICPUDRAFT_38118 [Dictyostelium purpureum]|uniref:Elongator complex protein 6 n=1 Tax=Dictyostelium purpureum TaxID=5786 RepID=F0ZTW0_DICPU|nr:uncharacterized protein DICPUDRAFT_38118 [Dictyostelium purpureum]EGC32632.1 hypothetical protein DICPUDRAFT_38118 [Dictyostelium purpureum]|eukprot:XP_003290847.1 hypothetical protein DICPUDRAFT_38118 [Dictyostelium purpureum]